MPDCFETRVHRVVRACIAILKFAFVLSQSGDPDGDQLSLATILGFSQLHSFIFLAVIPCPHSPTWLSGKLANGHRLVSTGSLPILSRSTQEIGIRLALGASRGGLLGLIIGQAAGLIFIGSTIGIGAALLLNRLLVSSLVGVTPHDVLSFPALGLMITVAMLASFIPASHATRTYLISAFRSE